MSPELHGPVISITSQWTTLQPDGSEITQHSQVTNYDDNGRVLSVTCYKSDNTLWYAAVHRYDTEGNLCETVNQNCDGSTYTRTIEAFPANPKNAPRVDKFLAGKRKKGFTYHIDGVDGEHFASAGQRVAVFYDAAGKALKVGIRNRFGMPVGLRTFNYDPNGRLVNMAEYGWSPGFYSLDGTPSRWRIAIARLMGPIIGLVLRSYLFWRCVYLYLQRRDFLRLCRCLAYGALMREESRGYDNSGRIVEKRDVVWADMLETRTTRSYDDRGLVLEEHTYDRDKLSSRDRYTREFDEYGNWTKEIMNRWPRGCDASGVCDLENEGTFITYRAIKYAESNR